MEKIVLKGLVFLGLFFGVYFSLQQIDWMNLFHIQQTTESNEQKIGELIWKSYSQSETLVYDSLVTDAIDSLLQAVCESNDMDASKIKLHIIQNPEVNAFALPNSHLIIYTGLITECENETELCGVMAHELAHMELDHVMKKMVKEIGLATLVSMTAGNGAGQVVISSIKHLTSSAYDRNLEKEADIKAVDYLVNAHLDPEQFANFMFRLGDKENEADKYLQWVNTHPNSSERAAYIITYNLTKPHGSFELVLSETTWEEMQFISGY